MNILVTGSQGFLGRHLCTALRAAGHTVLGVDLPGTGAELQLDLADHNLPPAVVTQAGQPVLPAFDHVVHLAGLTGRLACDQDPARAASANVAATHRVARACAECGVPLLYASSSEVYGHTYARQGTVTEAAQPRPASLYGWTKLWGEQVVAGSGAPLATIARLAMPYGPGHPPGPGRAALTNWLWSALRDDPLVVHEGARSWCYVADTVEALRLIVEWRPQIEWSRARYGDQAGRPWLVHVGRDDDLRPNREVALLALELTGNRRPDALRPEPRPPEIAETKRLSSTVLRLQTPWRPVMPLEEGMRVTAAWLRQQAELGKL